MTNREDNEKVIIYSCMREECGNKNRMYGNPDEIVSCTKCDKIMRRDVFTESQYKIIQEARF